MQGSSKTVRLDKWLWAARFYKTRAIAAEAVGGGKVHVNGVAAKPAKGVRVGDELMVRVGVEEYRILVMGLSERRGPASEATLLYEEREESLARRTKAAEQRRLAASAGPVIAERPTKKDRRALDQFRGR